MGELTAALARLDAALDAIERTDQNVRRLLFPTTKPGHLAILVTGEIPGDPQMKTPDLLIFDVILPALPERHDVISRELTVTVAGVEQPMIVASPSDTSVQGLKGEENADVTLSLVDVDNAGQRSQPSTLTAMLIDTIEPATPNELGLVVTGEEPGVEIPDEEPTEPEV